MPQENLFRSEADAEASEKKTSPRLDGIDLLRGIVMVIMALDHTRDYFFNTFSFNATDLSKTNAALFLTRWITHFCAPVFVFLAGTGAYLSLTRGKSKKELSRFLLTRGLWLVIFDHTVIRCLGWQFNFDYRFMTANVLSVIGWSMLLLSGLIFLRHWLVATFGIVMIAGHHLLDRIQAEQLGAWGGLWKFLHQRGLIEFQFGLTFEVVYPLIPWVGVVAVGFAFGQIWALEREARRKLLLRTGIFLTLAFVILRASNLYGDPSRWSSQSSPLFTLFSFINCTKYPPSLLYLLMTLGPAHIALALLDREWGRQAKPLIIFGRVPLFYYALHLFLIHLLAVIFSVIRYGRPDQSLFENPPFPSMPSDFGYSLPVVYLVWMFVVVLLYPACHWFAEIKRRRRDAWLSYL